MCRPISIAVGDHVGKCVFPFWEHLPLAGFSRPGPWGQAPPALSRLAALPLPTALPLAGVPGPFPPALAPCRVAPAAFPLALAPLLTSPPLRALPPAPAYPGPHPLTTPPAFPLPGNAMALCLRLQIHFILFYLYLVHNCILIIK